MDAKPVKPRKTLRQHVKGCISRYLLLLAALLLQVGYWYKTKDIEPDFTIVPDVPGKAAFHALTFGDDEFFFRVFSFNIQNAGDTFGRFTALRYYDFNKLYHWFNLLDELDNRSNMIPAMATYYFSQTQNTADVRYIVDYLYQHSTRDVEHKWWWLLQSIYLSMHKLNDLDLAIKVAKPLQNDKVPVWARQMTAVVYDKRGEVDDALRIMETIKENVKDIPDSDLQYMTYFVKERAKHLGKSNTFGSPFKKNPNTSGQDNTGK
jgi:hypothetical protein